VCLKVFDLGLSSVIDLMALLSSSPTTTTLLLVWSLFLSSLSSSSPSSHPPALPDYAAITKTLGDPFPTNNLDQTWHNERIGQATYNGHSLHKSRIQDRFRRNFHDINYNETDFLRPRNCALMPIPQSSACEEFEYLRLLEYMGAGSYKVAYRSEYANLPVVIRSIVSPGLFLFFFSACFLRP
jgi:hypothetical protein